ncbi:MAG: 5'-3' exonuclease [Clostridia bacterium]|nr:5'-3' exonuclease [Clostridia bacterium]
MKNRLLLIDGHNLLFQMFFGMPTRIPSRDGFAIQGVIGFVGAVGKLINMLSPTHVLILFDSETHNPRFELLEDYKAGRPDYSDMPDDENPFTQLPYIYRALNFMGIAHTEVTNAETDDVIASYALTADADTEVYISSFDSDYFQLITNRVKIIRYRGDSSVICDSCYILKKLGIIPSLYRDFKALVGDTSDNIGGIRGVGPKTAAKILNEYGSLEELLPDPSRIPDEKTRRIISENYDLLLRNIALIGLDTHAPMPFSLDKLHTPTERFRTMDVIRGIGL